MICLQFILAKSYKKYFFKKHLNPNGKIQTNEDLFVSTIVSGSSLKSKYEPPVTSEQSKIIKINTENSTQESG